MLPVIGMGYRSRWMAVKGLELDVALSALGLRVLSVSSEEIEDIGHYALHMPTGWLIVIGDGLDEMETVQPEHVKRLSVGTEALHFYCDDTPMSASLIYFQNGNEIWSLVHDLPHPIVAGTPSALVKEIVAKLELEQHEAGDDGCDYVYDAAPEIGKAITGFRHDQTLAEGEFLPVYVLELIQPRSRPRS